MADTTDAAQSDRNLRPQEGEDILFEHGRLSGDYDRGVASAFRWHINGWVFVDEDGEARFRPVSILDAAILEIWRLRRAASCTIPGPGGES